MTKPPTREEWELAQRFATPSEYDSLMGDRPQAVRGYWCNVCDHAVNPVGDLRAGLRGCRCSTWRGTSWLQWREGMPGRLLESRRRVQRGRRAAAEQRAERYAVALRKIAEPARMDVSDDGMPYRVQPNYREIARAALADTPEGEE